MTQKQKILVIDDDSFYRDFLTESLKEINYKVTAVSIPKEAFSLLGGGNPVILLALNRNSNDTLRDIQLFKQEFPFIQIIVLSRHPDMKTAFHALRLGAFDFLSKSPNIEEFIPVIDAAYKKANKEMKRTQKQVSALREDFNSPIIGNTLQIRSILKVIRKVAATDSTILILGETGVGKELVARAIYCNSLRADSPYVVINCGAIPDNLIESEIFGHEKGAFTDAVSQKAGLLEEADGGTVFFDEISELNPSSQVKLLRAVETGKFRRLGSNKEIQVNARIISASNRDLFDEVRKKRFRADLYYRLAVVTVNVPSLRERKDDIPVLVNYFLQNLSEKLFHIKNDKENNLFAKNISSSAMKFLVEYEWPGNIRELKNVIERLLILSENKTITPYDIAQAIPGLYTFEHFDSRFEENDILPLHEIERRHIKNVLEMTGGRKGRASRILGISERTLYAKLKQYDMSLDRIEKKGQ